MGVGLQVYRGETWVGKRLCGLAPSRSTSSFHQPLSSMHAHTPPSLLTSSCALLYTLYSYISICIFICIPIPCRSVSRRALIILQHASLLELHLTLSFYYRILLAASLLNHRVRRSKANLYIHM